jgi:hypothetical protein
MDVVGHNNQYLVIFLKNLGPKYPESGNCKTTHKGFGLSFWIQWLTEINKQSFLVYQ